ncbi:MAG: hypothetical protein N3A01_09210 [Bacteroidales bacterium]|nr:hypothetical protein [Bacteroidales bacterium]
MKLYVIFCLVIVLNIGLYSQKLIPEFNFITDKTLIFYENEPTTINLEILNSNSAFNQYIYEKIKKLSIISDVKVIKENIFEINFLQPLSIPIFKFFVEQLNAKYFYINKNKIYLEDLITKEEIEKKKSIQITTYKETPADNNPNNLEYYNYNIYNIEAKLHSLYFSNYPYHLLNGNVARLREKKDYYINERAKFLNNKN